MISDTDLAHNMYELCKLKILKRSGDDKNPDFNNSELISIN